MKIESRLLSAIKPYQGNPRINDGAIDAVAKSITEFGFRQAIVVDQDGTIICGHTRFAAAQRLGLKRAPVHVATDLSPDQIKAYRIADNQTATLSRWDQELLRVEVADLKAVEFDLDLLAFKPGEIDRILGGVKGGLTDPDAVPETPKKVTTQPGDLWELGSHRLLCGDSTSVADVERLMQGERAVCIFTDPPYGVSQAAKNRLLNASAGGKGGSVQRNGLNIVDDDLSPAQLEQRLLPAFVNIRERVMAEDCTLLVTSPQGGELSMMMMMMMMAAGLAARHVLIWKKNTPTFSMGRLDYDYQHEPILMTWRKKHRKIMAGKHKTSVWEVDKPRASPEHPTMKPVELYLNAYLNHSAGDDAVFDGYCGSGTALIAAEQLGRRCFAMEIAPEYCDVAVKRWEEFTGQKAVRHGQGRKADTNGSAHPQGEVHERLRPRSRARAKAAAGDS